jgi:hypothetical protein
MQYIGFDLKTIFVSILFFFSTCQLSAPTTVSPVNKSSSFVLPEPRKEGSKDYRDVSTKLTLIILENEKLFAYEGTDANTGKFYAFGEIRQLIRQVKGKYSKKEFVVIIKPVKNAGYKVTVDILDEMVINQIGNYSISEILPEEKKMLRIEDFSK